MIGGPDASQLAGPQHNQPNMNAHERPLTEKDALAWLLAKPSIETTVSELSRQWGWNRTKVLRRLKRWADEGYLIRTTAPGGR
jgi:DNA-binding MarR family transcriptional regulator